MTQIGISFEKREMQCKCGCGKVIFDPDLIRKLDALREDLGRPIIINSGYRCEQHNQNVGGSPNSQHLYGKAADIRCTGITPEALARYAGKYGFDGIGLYRWGIHVDVRGYKARWDFR